MGNLPREISPSLVEIGDTISVELPAQRGIKTTLCGKVGKRMDNGGTRNMLTAEGAILLSWDGKDNKAVIVTLHARSSAPQLSLFDMNFDGSVLESSHG